MFKKIIVNSIISIITLLFLVNAHAKSVHEVLVGVVNTANKELPMMFDEATRWDRSATFDNKLILFYTLVNYRSSDLSVSQISDFKKEISKIVINTYCTSPDMGMYKKNKIVIDYTYGGWDSKHIFTISVNYKDCE